MKSTEKYDVVAFEIIMSFIDIEKMFIRTLGQRRGVSGREQC